jgi:plastocyanin
MGVEIWIGYIGGSMQTAEKTPSQGAREKEAVAGLGWREMLVWLAIGVPVALLVGMVMIGEFIPPIVVFAVLFVVGAFVTRRGGRAGPITLAILSVALVAVNAPFIIEGIAVPASTVDFLMGTITTVLAVGALVAAIATLRRGTAPSRTPRTLALGVVAVTVALIGVAVVARVTYDQPVAASGDVTLATQDSEFRPGTISAEGGEVTVFVENADNTLHTFTVEELDVDLQIPGKANGKVTFDAEPGTYKFVCVPHEGLGMTGTLEIR